MPSYSITNAIYHGFIDIIFTLPGEYLAKYMQIFEQSRYEMKNAIYSY